MKGVGKPQYYLGGDVVGLGPEWEKECISESFSAETYIHNALPKLAKSYGYIRSEENVADLLTKPLVRSVFERLCSKYLFRKAKTTQGSDDKKEEKLCLHYQYYLGFICQFITIKIDTLVTLDKGFPPKMRFLSPSRSCIFHYIGTCKKKEFHLLQ